MAIITTSLPDYVSQTPDLLVKAALGAKTLDVIEIMPNVKYKTPLNTLDSTVVFADGETCGFNAQGNDTINERMLEVHPIKVNKEFCPMTLRKTYANYQLLVAAGRETLPFEEKFIQSNIDEIQKTLEKAIWQGSGALMEGFVAQIEDASSAAHVVKLSAGSSAQDVVESAYANLPGEALNLDPVIFVSETMFSQYVQYLNANCCANRAPYDAAEGVVTYPNDSRVRVIPTAGLEGLQIAVAGPASNFVYGTDIEDSDAIYDFWFDRSADQFRLKVLFNAGTQIKWPEYTVMVEIGE